MKFPQFSLSSILYFFVAFSSYLATLGAVEAVIDLRRPDVQTIATCIISWLLLTTVYCRFRASIVLVVHVACLILIPVIVFDLAAGPGSHHYFDTPPPAHSVAVPFLLGTMVSFPVFVVRLLYLGIWKDTGEVPRAGRRDRPRQDEDR